MWKHPAFIRPHVCNVSLHGEDIDALGQPYGTQHQRLSHQESTPSYANGAYGLTFGSTRTVQWAICAVLQMNRRDTPRSSSWKPVLAKLANAAVQ